MPWAHFDKFTGKWTYQGGPGPYERLGPGGMPIFHEGGKTYTYSRAARGVERWDWISSVPSSAPIASAPPADPAVATGVDPGIGFLYDKVIPLFVGGAARIGTSGLIWGPSFNAGTASFAVSFGFPANPEGTRRVYEVSLDGKVAWELAAGSVPGALNPAGFLTEPFTCRFYGGSLTQAADPLEIAEFGDQAVAYRPHMMLWFQNLPIAQFDNKAPFVSAIIGDTTDGATPLDGINLGEALERIAASPWLELQDSFETTGVADIVQAMILTENQSFLNLLQVVIGVYRTLDILQTDMLRVVDRGANVTPDVTLERDHIVASGGVAYVREEEGSVPRELELVTIDPDADYVFMPSKAARPRHPVPVTSTVAKQTITLPVVIGATTRASLVTFAKYEEENARKRISLQAMLAAYELEPGDLFSLAGVAEGFDPVETWKVTETSHGANYIVELTGEAILKCAIPSVPPDGNYLTHYETASTGPTHNYINVAVGPEAVDRLIVITAGGITNNRTITSITINGNAMTIHENIADLGTGFGDDPALAIASLVVPTGTTATVAVAFSGLLSGGFIGVYAITGYASATPHDTATANALGSNPSTTLDIPAGGTIIAAYCTNGSGLSAVTWTGVNDEDFDEAIDDSFGDWWGSGAHQGNAGEQTARAISVNGPSTGRELLVAAVWS